MILSLTNILDRGIISWEVIILTIGDRIKVLRKHKGLTQEQFAAIIHTSRSNLGNVETNTFSVTDRMIYDICREFQVSEDWLRTGEGEMFVEKTREEEILDWATSLLSADNEFKRRFIYALSRLDEAGWLTIEHFAQMLYEEQLAEEKSKQKGEGN